jgi:hypothetical protein
MAEKRSDDDRKSGLSEASSHYHGHRKRPRARFREAGAKPSKTAAPRPSEEAASAVVLVERARPLPHRLRRQGAVPRAVPRRRHQLIADELQQVGREVVKRALELSATALILVNNHPSDDPTPSRADIQMMQAIVDVAKPLGISVHDHIIVQGRPRQFQGIAIDLSAPSGGCGRQTSAAGFDYPARDPGPIFGEDRSSHEQSTVAAGRHRLANGVCRGADQALGCQ